MKFADDRQLQLPLMAGVVQAQRLVLPTAAVHALQDYRHACRLAWKLRTPRITQRTLAELAGLYPSHVSDYFSIHSNRRELPAQHVAAVCRVLGNTVILQWLAAAGGMTVLEELQASLARRAA
jgi:hypothetical protein